MAFMRDAKNLNWAFVCTDSDTAVPTAAIDSYADLDDNVVVAVDKKNVPLAASELAEGAQFKLVQRLGNKLFASPLFTFKSASGADSVAATQQVTTIGSSGTTAVLLDPAITDTTTAAAAVGNSYYVLIEKNDNDEATRTGYRADITAQVKLTDPNSHAGVDAELLQVRLAELLRESLRKNDQFEACGSAGAARYLSIEVDTNDDDNETALAAAGTVNVKFGSTTVTLTGSTFNVGAAEGAYISVGQKDIYRIKTRVSATVLELDFPFAGTTAGALDATDETVIGFLTAIQVQAVTGVGLRITGTDQHEFDVDRHRMYSQSRFNVRFAKDGEGVGTVAVATQASEGVNDWRVVSTDIYNSMGNFGQRWNGDVPAALRDTATTVGSTKSYAIIDVAVSSDRKELMYSGTATQKVRIYLQDEVGGTPGVAGVTTARLIDVFLPSGQSDIIEA